VKALLRLSLESPSRLAGLPLVAVFGSYAGRDSYGLRFAAGSGLFRIRFARWGEGPTWALVSERTTVTHRLSVA
jgi:hypothetical protein